MSDAVSNALETGTVSSPALAPLPTEQPVESAGQSIRLARESAGLSLDALAAALKVPSRKLHALETEQWQELTDTTFARALAASVARHLKLDPERVLAGLPSTKPVTLSVSTGLGRAAKLPSANSTVPSHLTLGVGALLLAASAVFFSPHWMPYIQSVWESLSEPAPLPVPTDTDMPLSESPVGAANEPTVDSAPAMPTVAVDDRSGRDAAETTSPPTSGSLAPAGSPAQLVVGPLLEIRAQADTWVEVKDETGQLRMQRVLKMGELVQFRDSKELTVVIGNAAGAQVQVRGQLFDLPGATKNNIARFFVN